MTLRDIGTWFSETFAAFLRDLDIVLTASPLDWPLYMVVLTVVAFLVVMTIVFGIVEASGILEPWRQEDGTEQTAPEPPSDKVIDGGSDVAFLCAVFFLVWIIAGAITAAVVAMFPENVIALAVLIMLPPLIAAFFMYLVILGRREKKKETDTLK